MTMHSHATATLLPIARKASRAIDRVPAYDSAARDYACCRANEAAFLSRVEAGGSFAVARAAARYPFAAPFSVPAAAQDIIRDAMAASVPHELRPKPDHSHRYAAQMAQRAAQIDRVRDLLTEGASQKDVMRLMGITRATARQYIMAATA